MANNGNENIENLKINNNEIKLIKHNNYNNLGYLNGIRKAIENKNINTKDFDFLIISNVDLELSKNFF